MKFFRDEILKFYKMLLKNEHFAIARFGDGEMLAMNGVVGESGSGEWQMNQSSPEYSTARQLLHDSFVYQEKNYYVGIVCPCCQGQDNYLKMKIASGQPESNLTFANIFVNANYECFVKKYIPLFIEKKKIILVANEKSIVKNLPFDCQFFPVGYNAWANPLVKNFIEHLKSLDLKDYIFLFACGPLGKILTHQLYADNKENTYLDIGSTLHPWIQSDLNIRTYYQRDPSSFVDCVWG